MTDSLSIKVSSYQNKQTIAKYPVCSQTFAFVKAKGKMDKEIVLTSLTKDELKNIIRSVLTEVSRMDIDKDEAPISQSEALRLLGCSAPTLLRWRSLGLIPFEKPYPGSRKVRYYKSQIKLALLQNAHLLKREIK